MRLIGFMKNGKGTLHEPEELFAATGTIDVVSVMDGGISVVEVKLSDVDGTEPKARRGRKPKNQGEPLTNAPHTEDPAE